MLPSLPWSQFKFRFRFRFRFRLRIPDSGFQLFQTPDESEDEEPRIKDVLSHLSRAVLEKRASDLLHSMAASKDILFWTSADNYFEINV